MTDETDPTPPADGSTEPTQAAAPTPPPLPSVSSAQVAAMWSKFGPAGQLIFGGSIALIVIALLVRSSTPGRTQARWSAWS